MKNIIKIVLVVLIVLIGKNTFAQYTGIAYIENPQVNGLVFSWELHFERTNNWTSGFLSNVLGSSAASFNFNTTGVHNTAIGFYAGSTVTTGSHLILIGDGAQPSTGSAVDQITPGDSNVNSLRCNVQTITSLSDIRDKTNITDLTLELDFVTKLKPR